MEFKERSKDLKLRERLKYLKPCETWEIICRWPYCFSDDEIEFDISEGVKDG